MPLGLLKSAVSAVAGISLAGTTIGSIIPQITSIAPMASLQFPSMNTITSNLQNTAMGYVTQKVTGFVNDKVGGVVNRVTGAVRNVVGGVSSVLSGTPLNFSNLTNTISNITAGNIVGNILGGDFEGKTNKDLERQMKTLVKKSAYNFQKFSEQAVLDKNNNPFQYETCYYPEEVAQLGDGHYLAFDILENAAKGAVDSMSKMKFEGVTSFDEATNRVNSLGSYQEYGMAKRKSVKADARLKSLFNINTPSGAGLRGKTRIRNQTVRQMMSGYRIQEGTMTKTISQSIILGMPNQNHKFDYKAQYSAPTDTGFSQQILDAIRSFMGGNIGNMGEAVASLGKEGLERFRRSILNTLLPGGAVLNNISSGFAMNPKMEVAFESVPFRNFSFTFDMIPKNAYERDEIHKIIKLFKFHMLPSRSEVDGRLYAPSEFQITYCYRENENMYIPLISRCAMTDFNVDYAPNAQFNTFYPDDTGAPPVNISMTMTFTELEIMTKETIAAAH